MIAEADLDLTNMAFDDTQRNRFAGDSALLVRFYSSPLHDVKASNEAGRPIYKDVDWIEIMQPGNKESTVVRPAREMDKQRFARHYAAYKANQGEILEGTPLSEWPGISRSQVEELKFFNVRTVEQLAQMSDANAQGHMGMNSLRTKAKAFIEQAEDNALAEKLSLELEKKDEEISILREALEKMNARLDELEAEKDDE